MIVLNTMCKGRVAVHKRDIKTVSENGEFATVELASGIEIGTIDSFDEILDEINEKEAAK